MKKEDMIAGVKYKIHYSIPGVYIRPREMVAVFLEAHPAPLSQNGMPELVFSGRPEFGTTELNSDHVVKVVGMVPSDTKCYHSRKF